jgi:hypothetical protein
VVNITRNVIDTEAFDGGRLITHSQVQTLGEFLSECLHGTTRYAL